MVKDVTRGIEFSTLGTEEAEEKLDLLERRVEETSNALQLVIEELLAGVENGKLDYYRASNILSHYRHAINNLKG